MARRRDLTSKKGKELSQKQMIYVELRTNPATALLSKKDLAEQLEVTTGTLLRWNKLPEIKSAISAKADDLLKEFEPEANCHLMEHIRKGKRWAFELFYELRGKIKNNANVTINQNEQKIEFVIEDPETGDVLDVEAFRA